MTENQTLPPRPDLLHLLLGKVQDLARVLGYLPRKPGVGDPLPASYPSPIIPDVPILTRLRMMQKEFEQSTVRLGIIGESGAGKSSLINAIVGCEVAKVGALIETTQEPLEVPVHGLVLVDLPGCGSPRWPRDTYIDRLRLLDDYDGFILVTSNRLKECDALLYSELAQKAGKPFFVVRSHFDRAVEARGETEARAVIEPHIREQLKAAENLTVYMVSSVGTQHFDLEKLILDIQAALPEWKQVRFIMAAHAYGSETLKKKRSAAERIVGVYAGLAAANALNPIPGLDVSIDLGILAVMARYVIGAYGFRPEQVNAIQGQVSVRAAFLKVLQETADHFAPYVTERFLVTLLRKIGMEAIAKESSKWVPFVGALISAGVGYKLTYRFGEQLIDDCEAAAQKMIGAFTEG